jgi:hypothetical protein
MNIDNKEVTILVKQKRITISLAFILLFAFTIISSIPFVRGADFSTSTITASDPTVYSLQNATITVTVQGTGGQVEGASVGIFVEGGEFPDSTNIYNDTSDSNGEVIVDWKAPLVDYDLYYNFTATIKMAGSTNVTRTTQVLVQPLDFSGSTVEALPSEINENATTTILVTAQGAGGIIEGANVELTGIGGTFDSTMTDQSTGQTNSSGQYSDDWTAPAVTVSTNYTIVLAITYDGTNATFTTEINVTVVPVEGQLVLDLAVSPGYTLEVGQVATIDVTVKDQLTNTTIADAYVVFSAIDGLFTENGLDLYADYTDAQGKITAHWETATLDPGILGTDYVIDLTASKISYQTNDTSLTFRVQEGELNVTITSDATAIDLGDSVAITVTVKLDNSPINNAHVTIIAQSGNFTGSSDMTIDGYTNDQGIFTATWDTSEMIMTGDTPIDYSFTVLVGIFPYADQEYSYQITVDPGTSTPDGGPATGEFYTQWWFYVAAGGGVIAIGTVIILASRKKA